MFMARDGHTFPGGIPDILPRGAYLRLKSYA